ncbi:hypothetical protein [Nostoc sp. 'Peltigera membranacea cyanobiont' 210A]|uniref:hypothetical protein n=1 Tax=Nostoc sp. 'Peltigera membranacea cyanobiont' 210A TaxID=2014529 RepID=UPI000B9579E3|nr:hypothetical protein [Nostoc sp. 'Peltigera membranacea cyanobiont' 210A]
MATRKRTTVPTADTVSIHDGCLKYMTTEQSLRLALSHVRPDDFDTVKAVSEADLEAIASHFQPQLSTVASNTSELPENSKTLSEELPEPATEQPQNTLSQPQQHQQLASPAQFPISNGQLTLIDQLTRQAGQEIELVDAIAQVKNQLILNNLAVRDAELAEGINQRWQYQKQEYLGAIRDLASLAKEPVAITPDESNLTQEIEGIITELGKKLIV